MSAPLGGVVRSPITDTLRLSDREGESMGWLSSMLGGGGSGNIRKGNGGKTFEPATKGRVIIRAPGKKTSVGNPKKASKKS
ncbi:MAG: hypothetical protein M3463_20490 [Verrucomicrobiota bacterium]|nr:hypothetical protein [Verrucomicrobiota bacterium]